MKASTLSRIPPLVLDTISSAGDDSGMSDVLQMGIWFREATPPLPDQIASSLREAILAGRLQPSQQLPAEPSLATQLKVSRATLRSALSILIQEGLLVRRHGIGTFVSAVPPHVLRGALTDLTSMTEVIRSQGYEPGTEGLTIRPDRSSDVAQVFGLSPEVEFMHITRTRLANGVPVIHCEEHVPYSILRQRDFKLPAPGVTDWSLYKALTDAGLVLSVAECNVLPVQADRTIAKRLKVKPGDPLLLLKQLHYVVSGEPVLYCENWHNTKLIEFQVIRRR